MRLNLRVVLFALVALVAAGAGITALMPTPEPSDSALPTSWVAGECSATQPGVTVVVDFGTGSKRDTVERCLTGFSGTGWDALAAAGFKVEGTEQYPSGFTCRVAGWPSPASQDCADTPSYKEGFWAYYFAGVKDSDWRFSGTGAALRRPDCGGYEGWRFVHSGEAAGQLKPRLKTATFVCAG